jgi:hypothetical protein
VYGFVFLRIKINMSDIESIWLTKTMDELLNNHQDHLKNTRYIENFIQMGIPILKKYKSGFLACMGDIQVCLLIDIEDNNNTNVKICQINGQGELISRLETTNPTHSKTLIKSFIIDFPEATLITSTQKPLYLFTQNGIFAGYMNLKTLTQLLSTTTEKILVGVP